MESSQLVTLLLFVALFLIMVASKFEDYFARDGKIGNFVMNVVLIGLISLVLYGVQALFTSESRGTDLITDTIENNNGILFTAQVLAIMVVTAIGITVIGVQLKVIGD